MKHEKFEDMQVWKDARVFVGRIYQISKNQFKNDFELMNQLRRAALSIVLNIAEGHERKTNKDFAYFITIAKASAGECRAALYIALDLSYVTKSEFDILQNEVINITRQLSGFGSYLVKSAHK